MTNLLDLFLQDFPTSSRIEIIASDHGFFSANDRQITITYKDKDIWAKHDNLIRAICKDSLDCHLLSSEPIYLEISSNDPDYVEHKERVIHARTIRENKIYQLLQPAMNNGFIIPNPLPIDYPQEELLNDGYLFSGNIYKLLKSEIIIITNHDSSISIKIHELANKIKDLEDAKFKSAVMEEMPR